MILYQKEPPMFTLFAESILIFPK